jgi:hypothetical protein
MTVSTCHDRMSVWPKWPLNSDGRIDLTWELDLDNAQIVVLHI